LALVFIIKVFKYVFGQASIRASVLDPAGKHGRT